MMRIGWNSAKKKVDIGRLIDWLGLWEFHHCGIPSLRGFEEAEAISLKIPSLRGFEEAEAISLKT